MTIDLKDTFSIGEFAMGPTPATAVNDSGLTEDEIVSAVECVFGRLDAKTRRLLIKKIRDGRVVVGVDGSGR